MIFPRRTGAAALGFTLIFWSAGLLVPLGAVLARAGGAPLLDPDVLALAQATVAQAGLSTAWALVLGVPFGLGWAPFIAARSAGGGVLRMLLLVPYGVPTVAAAGAWIFWLGRQGWLARHGFTFAEDWIYRFRGVVLAHIFLNVPLVALLTAQARARISPRELEAAATLGASPRQRFTAIVAPAIFPTLVAASIQVFSLCATSFALVQVLGGGPPVETLETGLYARVRLGALDLRGAAACAFWQLLLTLPAWLLLLLWMERRRRRGAGSTAHSPPGRTPGALSLGAAALWLLPYLPMLAPLGWIAIARDAELAPQLVRPFFLSAGLAAGAALGAVGVAALGLLAIGSLRPGSVGRALLLGLLSLPAGVSILVAGLGLWLVYGAFFDPFSGSPLAMVWVETIFFAPLALRLLWPLARAPRRRELEAAVALGATPVRAFWHVEWPRWRPVVRAALGLVAAASLGEAAAVRLFAGEEWLPLPLLIHRWTSQYHFAEAEALAGALILVAALPAAWSARTAARGLA